MPGRDNTYVPTNSSMYCPQLLHIESPDKRRELVRKINNLCTGCLRRCNPNSDCYHCTASKRNQPGKPCLGCKGHFLLGNCGTCTGMNLEPVTTTFIRNPAT